MKLSLFNLLVAGGAFFLVACQSPAKSESSFFRNFNLGAVVDQFRTAELQPTSGSGNSSSGPTGGHRRISMEYLLDEKPGMPFNEAAFLTNLKIGITQQISKEGAWTNQSGSNGDGFYFTYSTEEGGGSIDVISTRVEGNRYKLVCVVRENARVGSDT